MKISFVGYFLLVFLFSCNKNKQEFIYHPIVSLDLRDSHIVPYEGKYYAVGTCPPYWGGVNPGVKLYVSENLQDWRFDRMLIDASQLDSTVWYKDRFWAPELRKINNKFY